jgi:hypothetical protein
VPPINIALCTYLTRVLSYLHNALGFFNCIPFPGGAFFIRCPSWRVTRYGRISPNYSKGKDDLVDGINPSQKREKITKKTETFEPASFYSERGYIWKLMCYDRLLHAGRVEIISLQRITCPSCKT